MSTYLAGHLGARVSALIDGQMSREEADRAWSHVYSCRQCHAQVGREGWVKSRLAGLAQPQDDRAVAAPASLKGALAGLNPAGVGFVPALSRTSVPDRPHHPAHAHGAGLRPVGLTVFGGGALGAAMLGVLALGTAPTADPLLARQELTSSTTSVTTVGVSPTGPIEPVSLERPRPVGVLARWGH